MTIEEILQQMAEIIEAAEERDLTSEEAEQYEELETDLAAARRSQEIRTRQAAYETPVPPGIPVETGEEVNAELERAFDHFLRTGIPNADISDLQERAQGEGDGTAGGYAVPEGFRNRLVDRMVAFGGIASVIETISTSTGNPLPWPTLDDTENSGEIVEEHGTFSAGADLEFGTANLGAYKYAAGGAGATPLRVSVELLQDAAFDVQGLISRKLGQRIGRIQATHLISGTGVRQPKGIVQGLTGVELADDTAGVTYDDLVNFIHSVDPAYRASGRCRWAFNDQSLKTIRLIKDSNGDPIWRPDSATMATGPDGTPSTGGSTLLAYPVTIDQGFDDIDVDSASTNWGLFGDIYEGMVMRRVRDVTVVVNPWTRASYGEVEYSAWARMDAVPQNVNAYVALTGEEA